VRKINKGRKPFSVKSGRLQNEVAHAPAGLRSQRHRQSQSKVDQASLMAAHRQRAASDDPDLAAVIAAWDRLPEAVRAGIVAMVRAARGK
jgi:hypothetical protein